MAGRTRSRRPGETPVTSPRRRRSVPPIVFFAAAGVVVLIAVVAAAVAYVLGGDGGGGDRPQAAPPPTVRDVPPEGPGASAYSQAASTPAFALIADRSKDAKPLTAAQAFGTKKITDTDANASLRLTASSLDARCTTAIWGAGLAGRLAQGGCTQAVRATYSDQHFAALVTIFNMADATGRRPGRRGRRPQERPTAFRSPRRAPAVRPGVQHRAGCGDGPLRGDHLGAACRGHRRRA